MVNRRRGEIGATLNGERYTLCLTLGALAELEDAFGVDNLMDLANRFSSGKLSSRDIATIIHCGLQGAGNLIALSDVLAMTTDDGVAGFASIARELLAATFDSSASPDAGTTSEAGTTSHG